MANAEAGLASYAAHQAMSRGRIYSEAPHPYRGEYQRDRDRIVHSTAFRRLVYKTQVFVNHEGDHYRTRLTHSLEVAQIGRTVAAELQLNEQLVEAICLAHDLGHTPFGHAGQDSLNTCMRAYGGFEHNLQSLRAVDELEDKYANFPGLNLTYEAREGILKHCSKKNARQLGQLGERFLNGEQPALEAQLANLADEIAYNNHDVDDGVRAGLLSLEELAELPLFREQYDETRKERSDISKRALIHETVRGMINRIVTDLLLATRHNISAVNPTSVDDVRAQPRPLIGFSAEILEQHLALKKFLRQRLYLHPRVQEMSQRADSIVTGLFELYFNDPAVMPEEHANKAGNMEAESGEAGRARAVADYVAGMTDRYALYAYRELIDSSVDIGSE
ncbi:MAG: deoxyguanosinetriphosphate triphosphohydrolase [Gammaproteobacteria bacterium]